MGGKFYDNRELSWLKFNARVLEEAFDEDTPLFERLRFVQIFCSNLDEFFMIRVGSLHDKMLFDSKDTENKTNMTAREQLIEIAKQVKKLLPLKDKAYSDIMDRAEGLRNRAHRPCRPLTGGGRILPRILRPGNTAAAVHRNGGQKAPRALP